MANWSEDVPGLADRANMVSAERRRNEWVLTGLGISGPDNYFGQGDIWGTRILNKMKHNATTSCHIPANIHRLLFFSTSPEMVGHVRQDPALYVLILSPWVGRFPCQLPTSPLAGGFGSSAIPRPRMQVRWLTIATGQASRCSERKPATG